MKVLIAFISLSCLQVVFGDCPDCDVQSSFYKAVGCTVICRRKGCATNYICKKTLEKYKAEKKCFFNGTYYDVDVTLPERYLARDGSGMCNYQCNYFAGTEIYFFLENRCDSNPDVPIGEEQCNQMLQLTAGIILQLNLGISYTPGACKVGLFISFDLPPSNCVGSKCCHFRDNFYKRGTTINALGGTCTCLCPPVMICK